MAFRHPHPLLYVAFAAGIACSVLASGVAAIRELSPDATFPERIGRILIAFAIPAVVWLILLTVPFLVLEYLTRLRPGNRVKVTHGEFAGLSGTITDGFDPRPASRVPVVLDLDDDTRVVELSRYDIKKLGFWSH